MTADSTDPRLFTMSVATIESYAKSRDKYASDLRSQAELIRAESFFFSRWATGRAVPDRAGCHECGHHEVHAPTCSARNPPNPLYGPNALVDRVECVLCGDDGVDIPTSGRRYQAKAGDKCWNPVCKDGRYQQRTKP